MKMRKLKKFLCLVVTASMLTASIPIETFADETQQIKVENESEKEGSLDTQPDTEPAGMSDNASETTAPSQSETTPVVTEQQTEAQNETTAPSEQQTEAQNETTAPSEQQTETQNETTAPSEQQTEAQNETTAPSEQQTETQNETTALNEQQTETQNETTAPSEQQTEVQNETAAPGEQQPVQKESEENLTELNNKRKKNAQKPGIKKIANNEITIDWGIENNASLFWDNTDKINSLIASAKECVTEADQDANNITVTFQKDGEDTSEVKEPGSYTAKAEVSPSISDITLKNAEISFTIKKVEISEITWENLENEYIYNAQAFIIPTPKFVTDIIGYENVTLDRTDEITEIKNAGEYKLQASLSDYEKYFDFSNCQNKEITVKVKPKTIELRWSDEKNVTYDGKEHELACAIDPDDICNGDSLEIEVTYVSSKDDALSENGKPQGAGAYTVKAAFQQNGSFANYSIKNPSIDDFVIRECPITITWSVLPMVYDGKTHKPTVTVKLGEKVLQEEENDYSVTISDAQGDAIDAATYTAVLELKAEYTTDNYKIEGDTKCEFTIAPCPVEVTWSATQVYYNTKEQGLEATFDNQNVTDYTLSYYDANGNEMGELPKNAGSYKVTIKLTDSNYVPTEETKATTFTINKLPVTLFIQQATATKVYGEQDPKIEYEVSVGEGVPDSTAIDKDIIEEELGNLERDDGEKAAEGENGYPIKLAADTDNYEVTYEGAVFTITKRPITIAAVENQSKYYSQEDPKAFDYSVIKGENDEKTKEKIKEELNGEFPEGILTREEGENVAKYNYIYSNIEPANYTVTFDTGNKASFEIKKLPITITAKPDQSKIYGEKGEVYGYTIETEVQDAWDEKTIASDLMDFFGITDDNLLKIENAEGFDREVRGIHNLALAFDKDAATNYDITYNPAVFEVAPLDIIVTIHDASKIFGAVDPALTYDVILPEGTKSTVVESDVKDALAKAAEKNGLNGPLTREANENVGSYPITLAVQCPNYNIEVKGKATFTITKLNVTVTVVKGQSKIYSAKDPESYEYAVSFDKDSTTLDKEQVMNDLGRNVLTRKKGESVGNYAYALSGATYNNYAVTLDATNKASFEIQQLPITIKAAANQKKYYGANDPDAFRYSVENSVTDMTSADIIKELEKEFKVSNDALIREAGEDTGIYELALGFKAATSKNFDITYESDYFSIVPLPVVVYPYKDQQKIYGQKEPENYGFTAAIANANTELTNAEMLEELGTFVIEREKGEAVGAYKYVVIPKNSSKYKKTNYDNFDLTISRNAPTFRITPIKILKVQNIDSRQENFKVTTNLSGARQRGVVTKIRIEVVKYPEESDGINFSEDIDDYIRNATSGVKFSKDSATININDVAYTKQGKNKELLDWLGKLPAGTTIAVSIVDDNGKMVSSKKVEKTVKPVRVKMEWSTGNYKTNPLTGENYIVAQNGVANALKLRCDEKVEIEYRGSVYYGQPEATFAPSVVNSGSGHEMQTAIGRIVDTLNLKCVPVSLSFYVDDMAFPIPSTSIKFENRDKEIVFNLPEEGTVTKVSIAGTDVEISGDLERRGEHSFRVNWSGTDLIKAGTPVTIEYVDLAGNRAVSSTVAARSTVSTPITFRIRPELNGSGYLNGQGSQNLIVSGTACACEQITVTVAGMTQTVTASPKKVWNDENGSWETMFSMASLPQDQDFTIRAEYVDVNGKGYSITAKFDAFCASPSLISPVFEAMTSLSGMVETDTSVLLIINNDKQNYHEIEVDRFGHFVIDDVPMMFGGEDFFEIHVSDIAGNTSTMHYDIAAPGDPFEVTDAIHPLGKFFYSAAKNNSGTWVATPVTAADFKDEDGKEIKSIEIPLLLGMSYRVGTLTLNRTKNGFTVSSEIKMDKDIAAENYKIEDKGLYVYAGRPTLEDIKNKSGEEYAYGDEIPLGEGGTVWIVDDKEMTILADDIMDLKLYDYKNNKLYEQYQEK